MIHIIFQDLFPLGKKLKFKMSSTAVVTDALRGNFIPLAFVDILAQNQAIIRD